MYVLMIFVYSINAVDTGTIAVHSVPGFQTSQRCEDARKLFDRMAQSSGKQVKALCAPQTQ